MGRRCQRTRGSGGVGLLLLGSLLLGSLLLGGLFLRSLLLGGLLLGLFGGRLFGSLLLGNARGLEGEAGVGAEAGQDLDGLGLLLGSVASTLDAGGQDAGQGVGLGAAALEVTKA